MSKKRMTAVLFAGVLLLSACGNDRGRISQVQTPSQPPAEGTLPDAGQSPDATVEPDAENSAAPTMPPEHGGDFQEKPVNRDDISQLFLDAMLELKEEVQFNVAGMTWKYGAENDLKNIYYGVLSEYPNLKYAYNIEPSVSGDTAVCRFSYMPYKTGAYDSGIPAGSHIVGSLHDAKVMAQSMINGTERLAIAITDPSLSVEDIQLALAQAGYGWIRFDLGRDGTEIIAQPPLGKTLDQCAAAINESFRLGGEILSNIVTDDMTDPEVIQAVYKYIVENVAYDFRYYSDRDNMPYESMVALGALRDKLAICGGYAQAFQTLLDMAGIKNYTVSGMSNSENHMWNYVVLDGTGYYCDPTADRGGMLNHFMLTADELKVKGKYSWDHEFMLKISGTAE